MTTQQPPEEVERHVVWLHNTGRPEVEFYVCPGVAPGELPSDLDISEMYYCTKHKHREITHPIRIVQLTIALVGEKDVTDDVIDQLGRSMPNLPNYVAHEMSIESHLGEEN